MKNCIGSVLLGFIALLLFAPMRAPAQQQTKNMEGGLPWAYGFAAPQPTGPAPAAAPGAAGAAAPAAPAEDRETVRHLPDTTAAFAIKQIDDNYGPADWYPSDHPQMPGVVAHGEKPNMVPACGFCHYPNGKGRPNNAGPAGLPAAYILQQLQDFREGARKSWDPRKRNTGQMIAIAKGVSDEDAKAAAEYFASMKWTPYTKVVEAASVPKAHFVGGGGGLDMPFDGTEAGMEPIGNRIVEVPASPEDTEPMRNPRSGFIAYVPPGSIQKGEELATRGGNGKTVACAACHGVGLKGNENIPSLAGRSPSYLARQLLDIQHYTRNGLGALTMRPVVQNLTDDDILAIVAYVASLHP